MGQWWNLGLDLAFFLAQIGFIQFTTIFRVVEL